MRLGAHVWPSQVDFMVNDNTYTSRLSCDGDLAEVANALARGKRPENFSHERAIKTFRPNTAVFLAVIGRATDSS